MSLFSIISAAHPLQLFLSNSGVFITFDLSPIKIKYTEKQRSFAHFLTCISFLFFLPSTIFFFQNSFLSRILNSISLLKKKRRLCNHWWSIHRFGDHRFVRLSWREKHQKVANGKAQLNKTTLDLLFP